MVQPKRRVRILSLTRASFSEVFIGDDPHRMGEKSAAADTSFASMTTITQVNS